MAPRGAVLGVDLDSTIWRFPEWMSAALSRRLGYPVTPHDVESWEFFDTLPRNETRAAFAEALDPARIPDRPLYSGAPEMLRRLRERGMRLAFITSNPDPPSMRQPLSRWLEEVLGEPIAAERPGAPVSLQVLGTGESKLPALREVGAFGIVDDRPATLVEAADAGLWAATLCHPYNRALVAGRPDIHGFERWDEFESLLERAGGAEVLLEEHSEREAASAEPRKVLIVGYFDDGVFRPLTVEDANYRELAVFTSRARAGAALEGLDHNPEMVRLQTPVQCLHAREVELAGAMAMARAVDCEYIAVDVHFENPRRRIPLS